MSSMPSPTSSKPRRRLAAWLAFGAAGLATGAVWATGFASISGANGTTGGSPALAKTPPAGATIAHQQTLFGSGAKHGQHRNFIDQGSRQIFLNHAAPHGRMPDPDISDQLAI